jgi:hypothetical protein
MRIQRLMPSPFATCVDRLNETVFAPQATDTYFLKFLASITTDRHTTESSSRQKTDRRVRCSTDRGIVSLIRERQTRLSLGRARI